jgi:acyl-coenzyme A thioesterase PaaI-like protein
MADDVQQTAQESETAATLTAVREFLGGPDPDGDDWVFEFGEHLHSNWGAVYGGALAAAALTVARAAAPDRSPRSLHLQIVRSVPDGVSRATAEVRHRGRSVATIQVDLFDPRGKLAVSSLATMITPDAVAVEHHRTAARSFESEPIPVPPGAWSPPVTLALEMFGTGFTVTDGRFGIDGSSPVGLTMSTPWSDLRVTGPEVACLAADAVIAAPLVEMFGFDGVVGPNTDLTLRFTTAPATPVVQAIATPLSLQHGTAMVGIEIQAGGQQLAHGLATSLLLASS